MPAAASKSLNIGKPFPIDRFDGTPRPLLTDRPGPDRHFEARLRPEYPLQECRHSIARVPLDTCYDFLHRDLPPTPQDGHVERSHVQKVPVKTPARDSQFLGESVRLERRET